MKNTLIAALLVSAFGIATAQTATPAPAPTVTPTPPAPQYSPKVQADKTATQGERTELRADRAATDAEQSQLAADKAAGNKAAVKTDKHALHKDMHAKAHDKSQVEADHARTVEQRQDGAKK